MEDGKRPHCFLTLDTLDKSYIIVELIPPLNNDDFVWLYKNTVLNRIDDPELNKKAIMRYCVGRSLTKPNDLSRRVKVQEREEWTLVYQFRSILETPRLAFKHFAEAHDPSQSVDIQHYGENHQIVVIEYTPLPGEAALSRRPRKPLLDTQSQTP